MERYERLWERLLTLLSTLGEVDSSTPGRLKVTVDRHDLEIVMTEREWDQVVSIPHGSFAWAAAHVVDMICRAQLEKAPYLVHSQYALWVSGLPELLESETAAGLRRLAEHVRDHPDAEVTLQAFPPDTEST